MYSNRIDNTHIEAAYSLFKANYLRPVKVAFNNLNLLSFNS